MIPSRFLSVRRRRLPISRPGRNRYSGAAGDATTAAAAVRWTKKHNNDRADKACAHTPSVCIVRVCTRVHISNAEIRKFKKKILKHIFGLPYQPFSGISVRVRIVKLRIVLKLSTTSTININIERIISAWQVIFLTQFFKFFLLKVKLRAKSM